MAKHRPDEIRRAILSHVFWGASSPVPAVADEFGVTRQAVQRHVSQLVRSGRIVTTGKARYQRYRLAQVRRVTRRYELQEGFTEDVAWNEVVRLRAAELKLSPDETDICHYGLTEMTNNVIDHAEAAHVRVTLAQTAVSLQFIVEDDGVGIFRKVAGALSLEDPRQALLELSKGKFTTDPRRHTGEGVFFTSRVFDRFTIVSHALRFVHLLRRDAWLTEDVARPFKGTTVLMELMLPSSRTLQNVFATYSSGPDDYRFAKTHVPLKLASFGDESLVSRSSARRVLARAERFDEVLLDFAGVRAVGQAFADEIFRVFATAHPEVKLAHVNASDQVARMIQRARTAHSR
jgi:anti-sigma regulatory factor (Ser/Thr protein kinase)/biotin operon repressor